MTSSLQQLVEIADLTPPPELYDWAETERRLGVQVPVDYRGLIDAGGGGVWLDYIRTFTPVLGTRFRHVNLAEGARAWENLVDAWEDEVSRPPADFPAGAWLLRWASTGAGVSFYWEIGKDEAPGGYPIRASNRDGEDWVRYDMATCDLLLGIVNGEIQDEALNPSWLDPSKTFRPRQIDA